jgi:hypothetical protein
MPALPGVAELDGPKVELSPVIDGVLDEPAEPPPAVPVHGVPGVLSLHQLQLTVPDGGPPVELPDTVAESVHELPTDVSVGGLIVVVKPGVAGVTVKHSVSVCWLTEL